MDPELKDRAIDWIDPEKLLAEICAILLLISFTMRVRYHFTAKH